MEVWLLKKSQTCIHYDARARSREAEIRASERAYVRPTVWVGVL